MVRDCRDWTAENAENAEDAEDDKTIGSSRVIDSFIPPPSSVSSVSSAVKSSSRAFQ
jgi:hypothetical protein